VTATASRRVPARGWDGPGGGAMKVLTAPDRFRGTSVQVCGLWPFAAGSGSPMIGVPLGHHLRTGATVCADPISWFQRAHLISNPSMYVLGLPGLGKSTLVRRTALGLAASGVHPLVLGDLKPDYVDLIRALDGQVITLGHGRGALNVLDTTHAQQAAARLTGDDRRQLLADASSRRLNALQTLIAIVRRAQPTDREESILDRALSVLDDRFGPDEPVIADLLHVLKDGPDPVRQVSGDRGNPDRYYDAIEALESSLQSLAAGIGRLGDVFSSQTTVKMHRDRPVVFDISSINDLQEDLQAAVLVLCWSYGFGAVEISQRLADAGLEPRRNYFVVLDELWRALRSGAGMVDRVDALTRLNRGFGVGQAIITHSLNDLRALNEVDRRKAMGFAERAGYVVMGGLPEAEMPLLRQTVALSAAEASLVTEWNSPATLDPGAGHDTVPPGRGRFLLKVGGRPGIPFEVKLTPTERALNDTNKLWALQP
jgi:hypothetical protein